MIIYCNSQYINFKHGNLLESFLADMNLPLFLFFLFTQSGRSEDVTSWRGQCVKENCAIFCPRLLPDHEFSRRDMTPDMCVRKCKHLGHVYAGVQFKKQCFCGKNPPPEKRIVDDTQCNMRCGGDGDFWCGGFFRMNVYNVNTGENKFDFKISLLNFRE